jgi:pimeloyl-ACP methyl ester carboxylesterase
MTTHDADIHYLRQDVDGLNIFYREAGSPAAPAILLLHGFPSSSHMFRDLIPLLAPHLHVIAPDLPGFGFSDAPSRSRFAYTFDHLSDVIERFTESIDLTRYALYIFDYGAPIGLRLALRHPDRLTAIVSQNGNAYEEGLSAGWNPIQRYWAHPTTENRNALKTFLSPDSTKWQYTQGADETRIAPEAYVLDSALLGRPGNEDIQLDLFLDYGNNVKLYPRFQQFFREHRPPTLAVWGTGDPFFVPAGAHAFTKDNPDARVMLFETGHFALETHSAEIGAKVVEFLREWAPAEFETVRP